MAKDPQKNDQILAKAIAGHLEAAREAAKEGQRRRPLSSDGPLYDRAMSNLDAAESDLLLLAPPEYVVGEIPSLLSKVQRYLKPGDPRRQELERIAQKHGAKDSEHPLRGEERGRIVSAVRGADSEAGRVRRSVDTFRNIVVATTLVMTVLAAGIAVMGFFTPTTIPLCFLPEKSGQTLVVCPTAQSTLGATAQPGLAARDINNAIMRTVARQDLFIVELIGLAAASVAAANAIRVLRSSPDPWRLSVALVALKLPIGALTAFLGVLLMRGQFVPGLGALDTSGQILAWAAVFGYAQGLFTRLVDQQAYSVLDPARDADSN
jgi:hypothetical protein